MTATERDTAPRTTADSLTMRVVDAVAETRGVDPLDLPPLYDTVDPDLLADYVGLCRRTGSRPDRVAFDYAGCRVEVGTSGVVEALALGTGAGATPGSRMVRYECKGQEQVLVTEPDREEAWLRSDCAVPVEE